MEQTTVEKSVVIIPAKTMPITKYCDVFGVTLEQINRHIQRGIWQENIHVLKVDHCKERMVDLEEVDKWARKNKIPVA